MKSPLQEELRSLINRHSRENGSDTPDHILAEYMESCLEAFEHATQQRETWYGRNGKPWMVTVGDTSGTAASPGLGSGRGYTTSP